MRTGSNIRQRADGRFEARYAKARDERGRIVYGYCYGRTYEEAAGKRDAALAARGAVREMNLLILGAGAHGRTVRELAESLRLFPRIAFLDDDPENSLALGRCGECARFQEEYPVAIAAVGDQALRLRWTRMLARAGFVLPVLIHPTAVVSPSARIGYGSVVDRAAYQNAKTKYETQKERLAGQYKAKTVMFQTTLFLLAWYSLISTLFQAIQLDVFLSDCKSFFNDLASFIQTFVGWTIDAGHSAAQISTKIPNAFIAGMVYWLLLILIVGICMAGTGMLAILIEIKVIELYKKNCWDVITLLMILTSVAIVIYFGESIKKVLSVNLLLLFVLSQGAYVGIRCYLKVWLEKRPY